MNSVNKLTQCLGFRPEPGLSPVNNTTSRSSALLFQRYTVSPAFQFAAGKLRLRSRRSHLRAAQAGNRQGLTASTT
jgi:hypothetical protein